MAVVVSVSCLCASTLAFAQQDKTDRSIDTSRVSTALASHAPDTLRQFNASLVTLTNRVSQAVVQITVTGYGPAIEESDRSNVSVSHQRKIGSGVIVDSEGYILFGLFGAAGSGIAIAAGALPGLSVVLTGAVVFGAGLLQVRGGEFGFRALLAATLLECPQVPIDAYERKRLRELAHWAVAVLLGARPSLPQFALSLPPASTLPSGSYKVRHVEQEMVAGVLAVSAALPAA